MPTIVKVSFKKVDKEEYKSKVQEIGSLAG